MRKIPYIFATLLLAACTDGGTPTCVGPNGACGFDGLTPDKNRFIDNAATSNRRINMMIALNDAQVGKYIQHRLIGYTDTSVTDYAAVAQTALAIANGDAIADNVDDSTRRAAMYVVDPELFTACGDASDGAGCIDNWRVDNATLLATRLTELRARADLLDITEINFSTAAGADKKLRFLINSDGQINGINFDGVDYTRNGDTNVFTDTEGATLTYKSGVMDTDSGIPNLSYSDFGVYQITADGVAGKNIPFAGGYESRRIAESRIMDAIDGNLEFSGAAVGTVTNSENKNLDIRDDRAFLVFNKSDGVSTLTANFANWYNVTLSRDMNATNGNIIFSNYVGTADFRLPDDVKSGTADINMGYYGAAPTSGIPTEATGLVHYKNDTNGIQMDVAFGVKNK